MSGFVSVADDVVLLLMVWLLFRWSLQVVDQHLVLWVNINLCYGPGKVYKAVDMSAGLAVEVSGAGLSLRE